MRAISLNDGLEVLIDDEDYSLVSEFKWYGGKADQARDNWYAQAHALGKTIYMHRLLLGAEPGQQLDHIDRNGLNNQKSNLRICTQRQNNAAIPGVKSSTGFRGVEFSPQNNRNRYRACLYHQQRRVHLGYFPTAVAAAKHRDNAAREVYGEFAQLNFPDAMAE